MYSSHRRPKKLESIQKKSLADPRETHTITRSADRYDLVPQAAPAATLVWLHGLGGNPLSFVPYFTDQLGPSLTLILRQPFHLSR